MNTNSAEQVLEVTPGPMKEAGRRNYFERGAKLKLQSDRSFWTSSGLLLLALVQGVIILAMMPLKTVQTAVIHEQSNGALAADFHAVDNYEPDEPAIAYFMSEWVENIQDINASVIDMRLAMAGNFVVGDAVDQLRELIKQENPLGRLHQYPQLRRTYKRLSFNKINGDTAVLRYSLTERLGPGQPVSTSVHVMTITYTRVPPHTTEQVNQNPAGLYVTSFNDNVETQ